MSHNIKIQCAANQYKSKDKNEWMSDSVYDHFSLPILQSVHQYHQSIPGYQTTPLVHLKQFAADIGVDKVWIKDESKRFNLNAFKVLGASYSLAKQLLKDRANDSGNVKQGMFISLFSRFSWPKNNL